MKNTMNPKVKRIPEDKWQKTPILFGNYKMCSGDPRIVTWVGVWLVALYFLWIDYTVFDWLKPDVKFGGGQMSNLYIFEAWLQGFWLVEARSQIYIFLKHVLEEDIAESYVYQNWA